jgi:hypothetical protein
LTLRAPSIRGMSTTLLEKWNMSQKQRIKQDRLRRDPG